LEPFEAGSAPSKGIIDVVYHRSPITHSAHWLYFILAINFR